MAENKFGIWYVITRIALAVLVIIQLVLIIVDIARCASNNNQCSTGTIIWMVFVVLVLLIGLLAAYREHFLSAAVFCTVEIVLAITGFVTWSSSASAIGVVLCMVCAVIFTIMLYLSGSRDMNPPQIC